MVEFRNSLLHREINFSYSLGYIRIGFFNVPFFRYLSGKGILAYENVRLLKKKFLYDIYIAVVGGIKPQLDCQLFIYLDLSLSFLFEIGCAFCIELLENSFV